MFTLVPIATLYMQLVRFTCCDPSLLNRPEAWKLWLMVSQAFSVFAIATL